MYLSLFTRIQNIDLLEIDTINIVFECFYIHKFYALNLVYSNSTLKKLSNKRLCFNFSITIEYENTKLGRYYWPKKYLSFI